MGLDARPQDPLHHLGVGQRLDGGGLEAQPQRDPPHVHEHRRQGQRPRLRDHARRRGPALVAVPPRPAAVELRQHVLLRVRHRRLRPRPRPQPATPEGEAQRDLQAARQGHRAQGPQAGHQGLRRPPAAGPAVRRGPAHPRRERDRQPHAQRVVALGDHVRPLPRGRRDLREEVDPGRRDPRPVVPAPDARLRQHLRRPGHAPDDRQPQPPDRAPPLPRPAERPVRRGGAAGARGLREVRPQLPLGPAAAAGVERLAPRRPPLAAQPLPRDHHHPQPAFAAQAAVGHDHR